MVGSLKVQNSDNFNVKGIRLLNLRKSKKFKVILIRIIKIIATVTIKGNVKYNLTIQLEYSKIVNQANPISF